MGERNSRFDIAKNILWLFADKILRMGVGIIVGVWVARHLGPEQFGLFSFSTAVMSVLAAIASLGLNNIIVRDLVRGGQDNPTLLGTASILQFGCGLLCVLFAFFSAKLLRPGDERALCVLLVICSSLIFKFTDVIKYWFEAKVQSKYTVVSENAAFIFVAALRGLMVYLGLPVEYFAAAILIESACVAFLMLYVFRSTGENYKKWKFSIGCSRTLLRDAWPLILSGIAAMLYMRIDQIMLGQLLDDRAVGVYSAAVRLSEVWYFVPVSIAASVFPAIISVKDRADLYQRRLIQLFELMMLLALAVAIPVTFLSNSVIDLLYGPGYAEAASVLVIHIWTGVFVFSGVASSRWFVTENLQRYTFYRTLAGCAVNIALNYLLIPELGVIGAAYSSVVSQAVASVFFNALNRKTRDLFFMQMKAALGIYLFKRLYARYR